MTPSQRSKAALSLVATGAFSLALLGPAAHAGADEPGVECPRTLDCEWVPAAYTQTDPADVTSYGNYDVSERPATNRVRYIVIHDTEETYDDTIKIFQDPQRAASAHYVIRAADGHVAQMVRNKDVAWQAGNWYVNTHSVGIELEGYAARNEFTPQQYAATAQLVRYLAAKYDIPLDRQHIIGHDNVPGINTPRIAGMHWDPGPHYDWNLLFSLLGKPTLPTGSAGSRLVTVNPVYKKNIQAVRDCETNADIPPQPSTSLPLYTAPSKDAPRWRDAGEHIDGSAGTNCAQDTGAWVFSGQKYVVAERQPGWTAIWYQGGKAWFPSPDGVRTTTPQSGWALRPKAGKDEVPVYGAAYPEKAEYPAEIPYYTINPLPYTLKAGQEYASGGETPDGYYYAMSYDGSLPLDRTLVPGAAKYYTVQIGARIGFVKADDVDVVRLR
ncbi:peptidoglycan recognition family protein [Streptomyces sp. NPDC051940]|uniref:N-acetylmuramoyl-L-alanine amidase n=1 Tax=Streptomyces sp. NPDC051940 TaxID=3155675 RepID=UPI0034156494